MQATKATLGSLPALMRRSSQRLMTGLRHLALSAAMYRTQRASKRPPWMPRRPRLAPESLAIGAMPTSAASLAPVEPAEFGQLGDQRGAGRLQQPVDMADHLGLNLIELRLDGRDARVQALGRDLHSHCCCASASGRRKRAGSSHRSSTAVYSASIRASTASVLASRPIDWAKSRAWRGLTTATGRPVACSAQANSAS